MNTAKWRQHWPQRRPAARIYQLTDRLHEGHVARVPAHQIPATVSAWLEELGAHSPLVDDLERAVLGEDWSAAHALGECLSIEIALAD
ncbi:hypothetical protein A5681_14080 [Mycobacterium scrofulaceum]|uniref:hypothetical protein n=1 Tax=Mycobacterium scrofulaceum TaxID=1783 RepID=UPI000800670C|nr:hypothetical protein [Mycobacterium scrofulaceum]OBH87068.1 hypothetical protein A5681_14080 [Mycobacterium scrofulaceum]